jgi:ankyrin repeat protein
LLIDHGADVQYEGTEIWNVFNRTAITAAAFHGHSEAVKLLLRHGANIETKVGLGETPLLFASRGGDVETVRTLLAAGAKVNSATGEGNTALIEAAANGHTDVVELLLAAGADLNARHFDWPPLQDAVRNGHLEVVKLLLSHGVDVNGAVDNRGCTPLISAVFNFRDADDSIDMVKLLVESGANVNGTDNYKATPLTFAAGRSWSGRGRVVSYLIEHGANVNAVSDEDGGYCALTKAIRAQNPDVVRILLKAGANPNIKLKNGKTPLMIALDQPRGQRRAEILQALKEARAT